MQSLDDYDLARRLLAYHRLGHQLTPSDCIIVLGSYDLRVADRAAELFFERLAPLVVFSGRCGELTKKIFHRTEAEEFAERAIRLGVPEDHIVLEKDSTNTGENVIFSKQALGKRGILPSSAIAVQKPYMERRTFATFAKLWPELSCWLRARRSLSRIWRFLFLTSEESSTSWSVICSASSNIHASASSPLRKCRPQFVRLMRSWCGAAIRAGS